MNYLPINVLFMYCKHNLCEVENERNIITRLLRWFPSQIVMRIQKRKLYKSIKIKYYDHFHTTCF